jgi:hypothetical protein
MTMRRSFKLILARAAKSSRTTRDYDWYVNFLKQYRNQIRSQMVEGKSSIISVFKEDGKRHFGCTCL